MAAISNKYRRKNIGRVMNDVRSTRISLKHNSVTFYASKSGTVLPTVLHEKYIYGGEESLKIVFTHT